MGFWKDIGNAVTGVVNDVAGTNISVGSSSGGGDLTNFQKAQKQVGDAYFAERKAYYMSIGQNEATAHANAFMDWSKYGKSAEGQKAIAQVEAQLNAGSPSSGNVVKDIVNNALNSAKASTGKAVKGLIDKGAGALANSIFGKNTIPLSGQITKVGSDLASDTITETIKKTIKKNWWILILPGGVLLYILYRVFSGGKSNSRGRKRRR